MDEVPDEMLMAFADGDLPEAEKRNLEARLAVDADLRRRMEPYVASRTALKAMFDAPMQTAPPRRLVEAVRNAPTPDRAARKAADTLPSLRLGEVLRALGALILPSGPLIGATAGLAAVLSVGAIGGWLAGRVVTPHAASTSEIVALVDGNLMAEGALAAALERGPSGAAFVPAVAGDATVTPKLSFRTEDKRLCRQYVVTLPGGQRSAGFACRTGHGDWQVAHHEAIGGTKEGSGSYSVAGDGETTPALEGAVDKMIAGNVLSAEEEAQLVASRWGQAPQ